MSRIQQPHIGTGHQPLDIHQDQSIKIIANSLARVRILPEEYPVLFDYLWGKYGKAGLPDNLVMPASLRAKILAFLPEAGVMVKPWLLRMNAGSTSFLVAFRRVTRNNCRRS